MLLMFCVGIRINLQDYSLCVLYPFPLARDQILKNAREEVKVQVRLLTAHLVGQGRYSAKIVLHGVLNISIQLKALNMT